MRRVVNALALAPVQSLGWLDFRYCETNFGKLFHCMRLYQVGLLPPPYFFRSTRLVAQTAVPLVWQRLRLRGHKRLELRPRIGVLNFQIRFDVHILCMQLLPAPSDLPDLKHATVGSLVGAGRFYRANSIFLKLLFLRLVVSLQWS